MAAMGRTIHLGTAFRLSRVVIPIAVALLGLSVARPAEVSAVEPITRDVHLADLPDETRSEVERAIPESASEAQLLAAIDRLAPKRRFELDVMAVEVDIRWYSETVDGDPLGPIAVLRRWPGDTILAFYVLDPSFDDQRVPPLPGAITTLRRFAGADWLEWHGRMSTVLGDQPWLWIVRGIEEGLPHLGALVLPGDAGLGPEATPALVEEARWIVAGVQIATQAWGDLPYAELDQPLVLPEIRAVPGATSEKSAPWKVASASGFTIGLPPGIRTMRLDAGAHAPSDIPGGLLWLRGRFDDIEGTQVIVGDGTRAGYVARLEASAKNWRTGKQAPVGAPTAKRLGSKGFPRAAERTGARSVNAERWSEPGFDGDWLVFRLAFKDEGYEIGLPVLEGWQSPSLFWIPFGWRRAGLPPASSPRDPTDRFGFRFVGATVQMGDVPSVFEGTLEVPGLRLRLPMGILPAPEEFSDDGYPIRLVTRNGFLVGTLTHIDAPDATGFIAALPALTELEEAQRHHADRILANDEGWRLFVTSEGDLFGLEPGPELLSSEALDDAPTFVTSKTWDAILESVRLVEGSSSDAVPPPAGPD